MNNFKVGDKIRRISHTYKDIEVGDIGTVTYVSGATEYNITLVDSIYLYDYGCFKLVESKETNNNGLPKINSN